MPLAENANLSSQGVSESQSQDWAQLNSYSALFEQKICWKGNMDKLRGISYTEDRIFKVASPAALLPLWWWRGGSWLSKPAYDPFLCIFFFFSFRQPLSSRKGQKRREQTQEDSEELSFWYKSLIFLKSHLEFLKSPSSFGIHLHEYLPNSKEDSYSHFQSGS